MVVFLIILLSAFSLVILYLNQQFSREQKGFEQRIEMLQQTIAELNRKSMLQHRKMQLNDELEKTLKMTKPKLGGMLFTLNYDLFELLSKNNLLKR